MPVKPMKDLKKRDLAEEWAEGSDHRLAEETAEDRAVNKFRKGTPRYWGGGTKKGSKRHRSTLAIKEFMLGILDNPRYRKSLTRRILRGDLPQVELFMLTKTLGKPVEEISITANVPLFSLPSAFKMREDDTIDADTVSPLLKSGDEDAKSDGGSTS